MEEAEALHVIPPEGLFADGSIPFKYFADLQNRLFKQKNLNLFLESQNILLKSQNPIQARKWTPDYSSLTEKYGTDLAYGIKSLVEENEFLKRGLASSYREKASLHNGINSLNQQINDIKMKIFNKEYPENGDIVPAKFNVYDTNHGKETDLGSYGKFKDESLNLLTKGANDCKCTEVLEKLIRVIDEDFNNYHHRVWQHRVSTTEVERDEALAKNAMLIEQLVELQTRVRQDPFQGIESNISKDKLDTTLRKRLLNAYKELGVAQNFNLELERRLNFEQNISRSWQLNLRALQHELRDHFDDLSKVSQMTGPFCSLYMGEMGAHPVGERASVNSLTRTEKESIKMLRKARDRIEADEQRIKVFNHRIKSLEDEVAFLRVRNNTFKCPRT